MAQQGQAMDANALQESANRITSLAENEATEYQNLLRVAEELCAAFVVVGGPNPAEEARNKLVEHSNAASNLRERAMYVRDSLLSQIERTEGQLAASKGRMNS